MFSIKKKEMSISHILLKAWQIFFFKILLLINVFPAKNITFKHHQKCTAINIKNFVVYLTLFQTDTTFVVCPLSSAYVLANNMDPDQTAPLGAG